MFCDFSIESFVVCDIERGRAFLTSCDSFLALSRVLHAEKHYYETSQLFSQSRHTNWDFNASFTENVESGVRWSLHQAWELSWRPVSGWCNLINVVRPYFELVMIADVVRVLETRGRKVIVRNKSSHSHSCGQLFRRGSRDLVRLRAKRYAKSLTNL